LLNIFKSVKVFILQIHNNNVFLDGMESNATKLCANGNWKMSKEYTFVTDEVHLSLTVDLYDSRRGFVAEYSAGKI